MSCEWLRYSAASEILWSGKKIRSLRLEVSLKQRPHLVNGGCLAYCALNSILVRSENFQALASAVHVAGGFKAAKFLLSESASDNRFHGLKKLGIDAFDLFLRERDALVLDAGGPTDAEVFGFAKIVWPVSLFQFLLRGSQVAPVALEFTCDCQFTLDRTAPILLLGCHIDNFLVLRGRRHALLKQTRQQK